MDWDIFCNNLVEMLELKRYANREYINWQIDNKSLLIEYYFEKEIKEVEQFKMQETETILLNEIVGRLALEQKIVAKLLKKMIIKVYKGKKEQIL